MGVGTKAATPVTRAVQTNPERIALLVSAALTLTSTGLWRGSRPRSRSAAAPHRHAGRWGPRRSGCRCPPGGRAGSNAVRAARGVLLAVVRAGTLTAPALSLAPSPRVAVRDARWSALEVCTSRPSTEPASGVLSRRSPGRPASANTRAPTPTDRDRGGRQFHGSGDLKGLVDERCGP